MRPSPHSAGLQPPNQWSSTKTLPTPASDRRSLASHSAASGRGHVSWIPEKQRGTPAQSEGQAGRRGSRQAGPDAVVVEIMRRTVDELDMMKYYGGEPGGVMETPAHTGRLTTPYDARPPDSAATESNYVLPQRGSPSIDGVPRLARPTRQASVGGGSRRSNRPGTHTPVARPIGSGPAPDSLIGLASSGLASAARSPYDSAIQHGGGGNGMRPRNGITDSPEPEAPVRDPIGSWGAPPVVRAPSIPVLDFEEEEEPEEDAPPDRSLRLMPHLYRRRAEQLEMRAETGRERLQTLTLGSGSASRPSLYSIGSAAVAGNRVRRVSDPSYEPAPVPELASRPTGSGRQRPPIPRSRSHSRPRCILRS